MGRIAAEARCLDRANEKDRPRSIGKILSIVPLRAGRRDY